MANCIITKLDVESYTNDGTTIKYTLTINENRYNLIFDARAKWDMTDENRHILTAWLFNNDWPIDESAILSNELVVRALRQVDHPSKDFEERLNYFILNLYLKGGKEFKNFKMRITDCLWAFAESKNEFKRLLTAAMDYKYIESIETHHFITGKEFTCRLIKDGVDKGKELAQQKQLPLLSDNNRPLAGRKIYIAYLEEDREDGKNVEKLMMDRGATVLSHSGGMSKDNTTSGAAKQNIDNADFVLLIKSKNSDQSGVWRDILNTVFLYEEIYQNTAPFFYVLFADDSPYDNYPQLTFLNKRLIDLRIKPKRQLLFLSVYNIIKSRMRAGLAPRMTVENEIEQLDSESFNWPTIDLTPGQKHWLTHVYGKFSQGLKVDEKEGPAHWEKFGKEESPTQLHRSLLRGQSILLPGIWHVDKQSKYFTLFDQAIWGIRDYITKNETAERITSPELSTILSTDNVIDLWCVKELIVAHGFSTGSGYNDIGNTFHIDFRNEIRDKFRLYEGVEKLIEKETAYLKNRPNIKEKSLATEPGTPFEVYRELSDVKLHGAPDEVILGAKELAADIADIIEQLPVQQERIIGIFGPWGRGKSVLLNEIWNCLKISGPFSEMNIYKKIANLLNCYKQKDEKPMYVRVDYHAWKYQDTPSAWAYLYECFADEYYKKPKSFWHWPGWVHYYFNIIKLNISKVKIWPFIRIAAIAVFAYSIFNFVLFKLLNTSISNGVSAGWINGAAIATLLVAVYDRLQKAYSDHASVALNKYTARKDFKHTLGLQAEIQKEFEALLKAWIPENKEKINSNLKLVLFVEDLDRCSEEGIIKTIDGLRIMLENKFVSERVIVVCAIDEKIMKRAIFTKYKNHIKEPTVYAPSGVATPDMPTMEDNHATDRDDLDTLSTEYLDKIFLFAIRLGILNENERISYLNELIKKNPVSKPAEAAHGNRVKETVAEDGIPKPQEEQKTQKQHEEIISPDNTSVSGNPEKNNSAKEKNITGNFPKQEEIIPDFELLTEEESLLLNDVIRGWEGATPRQIRIFYYRYLFAKNLLIKKYKDDPKKNIWKRNAYAHVLPGLICMHGKLHNPQLIVDAINECKEADENGDVEIPFTDNLMTTSKDYIKLLSVLEMVVAY